jgi:hypothetical protein
MHLVKMRWFGTNIGVALSPDLTLKSQEQLTRISSPCPDTGLCTHYYALIFFFFSQRRHGYASFGTSGEHLLLPFWY